jgi:hypothetical protein
MLVEQARIGIAYMNGQLRALAPGTLLLLTLSLGGCASSSSSVVEARAEAPPKTSGYPSLEVLPPPSETTAEKQLKIEKELTAARDRALKAKRDASQTVQPTKRAARE